MKLEYREYECAFGWWKGYVDIDEECECHQCSGDSWGCKHHYSQAKKFNKHHPNNLLRLIVSPDTP